ncbi:MAG: O-antigen ligase family protein [Oscillospiraceae bacterium]|nr:O-antigen ligase family protein [Oscillospiraceae bacterium]
MDRVLRNNFVAKLIAAFATAYQFSCAKRFVDWWKEIYSHSNTRRILRRYLLRPSTLVYSNYYRFLDKCNTLGAKLSEALRPAVDNSFFFRLWHTFKNSRVVSESVTKKALEKLGSRGILIVCFTLYLPIDWLLRDVLNLASIASVWDELFLLGCVAYLFWRMLITKRERIRPRATPLDAPLFFFLAVAVFLMSVVSPNMGIAVSGWRAVCQHMLWFFVIVRLIEDEHDLNVFYYTFCGMCLVIALHGIFQYIVGAEIPAHWVSKTEAGVRTRAFSIIGSPNIMGCLLVMAAPTLASLAYDKEKPLWLKLCAWAGVMILCVATLVTFSRGAWFGLAIAATLFVLLCDRKLVLFLLIGVAAVLLFVPEVANRILYLFTPEFQAATNAGGRAIRWATGLDLLHNHSNAFLGFGLGRFGGAIAMQNQVIEGLDYFYMDNYYLKTLVEMGYAGLSSYIILLFFTLLSSARTLFKRHKDALTIRGIGMLCGMIGVLAHCYFENIFEVPYMTAYFWAFAAVIMFLGFRRKKTP